MPKRHWLSDILQNAAQSNWCVNLGCTTCGATIFKKALKRGLFRNEQAGSGRPLVPYRTDRRSFRDRTLFEFSADECRRLIEQLADVSEPPATLLDVLKRRPDNHIWQEAVESLLNACRYTIGTDESQSLISSALAGTDAGAALDHMNWRSEVRNRRREENLWANSPERRIERLAIRQAAHQQRLARKASRDEELKTMGEALYGRGLSRQELFRRLVAEGRVDGFWY